MPQQYSFYKPVLKNNGAKFLRGLRKVSRLDCKSSQLISQARRERLPRMAEVSVLQEQKPTPSLGALQKHPVFEGLA